MRDAAITGVSIKKKKVITLAIKSETQNEDVKVNSLKAW